MQRHRPSLSKNWGVVLVAIVVVLVVLGPLQWLSSNDPSATHAASKEAAALKGDVKELKEGTPPGPAPAPAAITPRLSSRPSEPTTPASAREQSQQPAQTEAAVSTRAESSRLQAAASRGLDTVQRRRIDYVRSGPVGTVANIAPPEPAGEVPALAPVPDPPVPPAQSNVTPVPAPAPPTPTVESVPATGTDSAGQAAVPPVAPAQGVEPPAVPDTATPPPSTDVAPDQVPVVESAAPQEPA
ncbi:MAG TPA: hypothetical protein VMR98_01820, partial [Candidatus Polarisedimenticolaceae bacterium]|nr:hypothetical protein [Candidatus Polarisedimenticolaceae bacterium]